MRLIRRTRTGQQFINVLATGALVMCAVGWVHVLAGCTERDDKPEVATWAVICVRNDQPNVRSSDESCDTAPDKFHWLYIFQNDAGFKGCPPVGGQLSSQRPDDSLITTKDRPNGTIGRVPYNGGWGVVSK